MLSAAGLAIGLAALIWMAMRNVHIVVAAVVASLVVAVFSGLGALDAMTGPYMTTFTDYVKDFFLIFLLGAVFGKLMGETGAAESIADWFGARFGAERAVLAIVLACAVLTYGGVSLFVVGFAVFPIALTLFYEADVPRRFIPGALALGSVTFTMTSAGSPEIQNLIPIEYLDTTPTAGALVSAIVAVVMAVAGFAGLKALVARARNAGERFEPLPGDERFLGKVAFRRREGGPAAGTATEAGGEGGASPAPQRGGTATAVREREQDLPAEGSDTGLSRGDGAEGGADADLPPVLLSLVPIAVILVVLNVLDAAPEVAIAAGVVAAWLPFVRWLPNPLEALGTGSENAIMAAVNTAAVVGFGGVAAETAAFQSALDFFTNLPGPPLVGAAASVAGLAAIVGSASGGLGIVLPIIGPAYVEQGVDPASLHRVSTIASGSIDSLPHSGYVVTTIRVICGETHSRAYFPMFVTTVLVPLGGTALAVLLFALGL